MLPINLTAIHSPAVLTAGKDIFEQSPLNHSGSGTHADLPTYDGCHVCGQAHAGYRIGR
jgi:hypothetical protein